MPSEKASSRPGIQILSNVGRFAALNVDIHVLRMVDKFGLRIDKLFY